MDWEEWDDITEESDKRALETLEIARELYIEFSYRAGVHSPRWWENQTVATQKFFLAKAARRIAARVF